MDEIDLSKVNNTNLQREIHTRASKKAFMAALAQKDASGFNQLARGMMYCIEDGTVSVARAIALLEQGRQSATR